MKHRAEQEPSHQAHARALRDRILAYLGLMNVNPVESLEIALKILERPEAAEPGRAFEILRNLLKERGLGCEEAGPAALAAELAVPPLNRQPMVSEGLSISIIGFLAGIAAGCFRPAGNRGPGPEGDSR